MTTVCNDPAAFVADAMRGFARLHADVVEAVPGGFVRAAETHEGKVAVVVGGGSGHYPAFAGWVGPGMADGAVVGDVFTSPSARQAYSVAKAAARGGGVLFGYGNYAGDVLNFDVAQEQLRAEGIRTETVTVTDDVLSAPAETPEKRRGVAGDLVVFKIAGAAAETGHDLDAVLEVARRANRRTVSLGVAFAGCTLPGAAEPLFTVPPGQMGVGLGVHGEPGVAEQPVVRSAELAAMLVDRLLTERPDGAGRVGAVLNGLGGTKYEELFVLWGDVSDRLESAGLTVVAPEVGELVTSLDMAGCSLTLLWLDEELEALWTAPAHTPAFHRGPTAAPGAARRPRTAAPAAPTGFPEASEGSAAAAAVLARVLDGVATDLHAAAGELGRLDAVAGDGDHGRGMCAGIDAAVCAARAAVAAGAGLASTLSAAGNAWGDRAGGTSGVLWGTGLRAASGRLSDSAVPAAADGVAAVVAARDHVRTLGKAQLGDKTLLDALLPFTDVLAAAVADGVPLPSAWSTAAGRAEAAAQATAELAPRVGRARVTAQRSVGHPDPGAVSLALVVRAVAREFPGPDAGE